MAGQAPQRREVLRVMSMAAAAAQFGGFTRWAFAGQEATEHAASYDPKFFTAHEYATVERLADLIIPADDLGPGAAQAGVAEFIDFMAASDPTIQYQFRYGLNWLNARAHSTQGRPFVSLTAAQQTEILRPLAYHDQQRDGEQDGRDFFRLVRSYTVMGFYTSRDGLKALEYPGLRMYAESPECPHADDPEHRHLPPPKV